MKIVIALGGNALGNSPQEQLELVKTENEDSGREVKTTKQTIVTTTTTKTESRRKK